MSNLYTSGFLLRATAAKDTLRVLAVESSALVPRPNAATEPAQPPRQRWGAP
jgi:hypothetical protein